MGGLIHAAALTLSAAKENNSTKTTFLCSDICPDNICPLTGHLIVLIRSERPRDLALKVY